MADRFKVTTDSGGTVNDGGTPKDRDKPVGLEEDQAQADAKRRNQKAEQLGIRTRYEVHDLEEKNG